MVLETTKSRVFPVLMILLLNEHDLVTWRPMTILLVDGLDWPDMEVDLSSGRNRLRCHGLGPRAIFITRSVLKLFTFILLKYFTDRAQRTYLAKVCQNNLLLGLSGLAVNYGGRFRPSVFSASEIFCLKFFQILKNLGQNLPHTWQIPAKILKTLARICHTRGRFRPK